MSVKGAATLSGPTRLFRSGPPSEKRVLDWERRSVPAVVVVSAVFMASMSWLFVLDRPPRATVVGFSAVGVACWAYFVVDYLVRLCLAHSRRWFLRARWPDLVLIVLTIVPHLHFLRVIALVIVVHHLAMRSLRNQVMIYALFVTVVLMWGIAVNVLVVERHVPHATIRSLGDAVWWAVTSVTTVGYGDTYPRTAVGRVLGGVLVFGGVALIGVWTASFANWLFSRAAPQPAAAAPAERLPEHLSETAELAREVRALRAELADLRAAGSTPPAARSVGPVVTPTGLPPTV